VCVGGGERVRRVRSGNAVYQGVLSEEQPASAVLVLDEAGGWVWLTGSLDVTAALKYLRRPECMHDLKSYTTAR